MTALNWTNVTNVGGILVKANETVPFWFGMEIMLFIIATISLLGFGLEVALLSSGFLCFVTTMLLSYMGLATWQNAMWFLGITILTILYIAYNKKE